MANRRWTLVCTCSAQPAGSFVHSADCEVSRHRSPPNIEVEEDVPAKLRNYVLLAPNKPSTIGGILGGRPKPERTQRIRKTVLPAYRFTLQFYFSYPVNMECWRRIKAPKGWKKCPTNATKQRQYTGVRFMCTDFKHALTPQQIEELHARLILSLDPT